VVISEFLSGPGVNTLPQVIFGYARRGINPTIYAAATLLIVTVTVVIVVYSVWVARQTRRARARRSPPQRGQKWQHYKAPDGKSIMPVNPRLDDACCADVSSYSF
jgi:ABC-type Fe3+ transport system permease subunit